MNPIHLLLLAALAVPMLALWPAEQDGAATDWETHVAKACTAPRFMLRVAAAKKVAGGGDAAVPAVRAWEEKNGRNRLPSLLVDAITDADRAVHGDAVLALLRDWATDDDFYWRSSALRGLALRAPALDPERQRDLAARFAAGHDDPAWLFRTHARFGSALLDDRAVLVMPEPDPRARVRFAALLLSAGIVPPLQPLLDALDDERSFLGDPWGKRLGVEAHKALKEWLGESYPADRVAGDDRPAAIEALRAAAAAKSGQELATPAPRRDPEVAFAGGVEVLSCKHGDHFVRWTADGVVFGGLDAAPRVPIPDAAWRELEQERAALALDAALGEVICDSMRLFWTAPDVHAKVAPQCLPAAATNWLEQLARRVEEAGGGELARDLRGALGQFAAR